ncbi:MAG TPA: TonB-dependent receptor [Steroidobacteraceae bacterium]|nr:TonB-dependent receptor [Steroidobacteraceae bacterium]
MPAAYAADAAAGAEAESGGLQEVVVTAQKRVENLQNVPISVQVFDTQKIEQMGIVNLDDYVKYSPSISYVRGQGEGSNGQPGDAHVYIRGVVSGGDGNHSGSQPSVGIYFDEMPVTTIDGTPDVHIYDVQRIEVLEGPQGTLFGASSESGTVRIISNKPDPTKFAAGYDIQGNRVDHGGTGYEVEGFVNIPLASFAAVRLVGWDEHDAGYISNVPGTDANACIFNGVRTFPTWAGQTPQTYACPTIAPIGAGSISNSAWLRNDYNTVDTRGGRGAIKFDVGDNWSITPTFMAQDISTEGFFAYDPAVGDLDLVHFGPENSLDSWYQAALTVEGKMSGFDLVYAGGYFKRDGSSVADYSDYSEFYDRVYGSGVNYIGNNGKPIMPQQFVNGAGYFEKWSHEIRLTTPAEYPVKGTVGAFIQRQLHDIWQLYTMPGYGYTSTVTPPAPGPDPLATAYSVPGFPGAIWLTDEQRVDRDWATFAQASWQIIPQLELTGGIRWYKYDNSLLGFFGYGPGYPLGGPCTTPPSTKFAPCTNLDAETSDHGTVPKGTLTYKITPEQLVYFTYSKGFRPGGVNRVSGPNSPPYAADYLINYEVGWKTEWLDHRVRWNGALFWEDWKNFQFSFLVPPSITAIANGGDARIKGVENELDLVPTEHLLISSNFTWLNPVLTENYCGAPSPIGVTSCATQTNAYPFLPGGEWVGPLAPAGTNLPVVPKFKGTLTARYTWGAINQWAPFAQASFTYQNKTAPVLQAPVVAEIGMMPAWGMLDLSGGVDRGNMNLQVFVSNATDKRAQLSRFTESNPVINNQVYILPVQPRTIGIKFSQRF